MRVHLQPGHTDGVAQSWVRVSTCTLICTWLRGAADHLTTPRRRRYASRLLDACEALAAEWGFDEVYLHAATSNERLLGFYGRRDYLQLPEYDQPGWVIAVAGREPTTYHRRTLGSARSASASESGSGSESERSGSESERSGSGGARRAAGEGEGKGADGAQAHEV